ncbi:MAG: hypothetical protein QOF41_432 [Methylobacteriaceae bacterium]|nr:hypothetical protein [Methylobacteriaceae bacterium]
MAYPKIIQLFLRVGQATTIVPHLIMTAEARKSQATGRCPGCDRTVFKFGGEPLHVDRVEYFKWPIIPSSYRCRLCGFAWNVFIWADTPETDAPENIEFGRSEEPIGEDRRLIDNSCNSTSTSRKLTFSREWARSVKLDIAHSTRSGAEVNLGKKESGILKVQVEQTLKRVYSVSDEKREICAEEINFEVAGYTKLEIKIAWKKIWQHGIVRSQVGDSAYEVPYQVAVGLTFDQEHVEEKRA